MVCMIRTECPPNKIVLAVVRTIEGSNFDEGRWRELGLVTGTDRIIDRHPRLLQSLRFGDDDYHGNVIEVVPKVLGRNRNDFGEVSFRNLDAVEDFLNLADWLRANDLELHAELYGGDSVRHAIDGLFDETESVSLLNVREYTARIERSFPDDVPAALGAAKELLEAVFKNVLNTAGVGTSSRATLPALAKQVHRYLGLDDELPPSEEIPGSRQRKDLLRGLNLIVQAQAELRNLGFGTGHGHSDRPDLDVPTARLAITAAIAAATFYVEVASAASG